MQFVFNKLQHHFRMCKETCWTYCHLFYLLIVRCLCQNLPQHSIRFSRFRSQCKRLKNCWFLRFCQFTGKMISIYTATHRHLNIIPPSRHIAGIDILIYHLEAAAMKPHFTFKDSNVCSDLLRFNLLAFRAFYQIFNITRDLLENPIAAKKQCSKKK